jgi:hypothetical protein
LLFAGKAVHYHIRGSRKILGTRCDYHRVFRRRAARARRLKRILLVMVSVSSVSVGLLAGWASDVLMCWINRLPESRPVPLVRVEVVHSGFVQVNGNWREEIVNPNDSHIQGSMIPEEIRKE